MQYKIKYGTIMELTGEGEEWLLDHTRTYVIAKLFNGMFNEANQVGIGETITQPNNVIPLNPHVRRQRNSELDLSGQMQNLPSPLSASNAEGSRDSD